MDLSAFFSRHPRATLAFSGGTDSAYLLWAGRAAGADLRPCFVRTPFQPAFELSDARRLCAQLRVPLAVLEVDILSCPQVASNPPDRCYHCKKALFTALGQWAAAAGAPLLVDGTNASDDAGDRPGMRALRELGVLSPLRECGITKAEVRRRSREAGLFTADKPAYACLATRVLTGEPLTAELLGKLERAEAQVARLGFTDFRVRYFHGAARLQLPGAQMERALAAREALREALGPDFDTVLLDLRERQCGKGEQNGSGTDQGAAQGGGPGRRGCGDRAAEAEAGAL